MRGDLVLLGDPAAVLHMVVSAWGVRVTAIGEKFPCLLPGHTGHDASLWRDVKVTEVYKYRCWRGEGDGPAFWFLSQVHAWIAYGKQRSLSDIECAVWNLRFQSDGGLLLPRQVALPPLSTDALPSQRKVYDGFALLVGLRWIAHYGQAVAYARPFAAAWCKVGERQAGAAIAYLVDGGVIVEAARSRSDPRLRLFHPATRRP